MKNKIHERLCYNFLKKRFDYVEWNVGQMPPAHYDFTCMNDGIVFNVDAKSINNNQMVLNPNQLDCAFFVFMINNKFEICSLKTIKERFGFNINVIRCSKIESADKEIKQ